MGDKVPRFSNFRRGSDQSPGMIVQSSLVIRVSVLEKDHPRNPTRRGCRVQYINVQHAYPGTYVPDPDVTMRSGPTYLPKCGLGARE